MAEGGTNNSRMIATAVDTIIDIRLTLAGGSSTDTTDLTVIRHTTSGAILEAHRERRKQTSYGSLELRAHEYRAIIRNRELPSLPIKMKMASSGSNCRISTLVALAIHPLLALGAPSYARMASSRDDEKPEGPCDHNCVTGIIAGMIGLICIGIIFLCVWSSRRRRAV
ncbi:hypothetical protein F5Y10DRAFT_287786 [Nemania abortiva]|nr:hypothetical protein F5Y10DRAFT_287786 [Nemania abortiva]